MMQFYKSQNDCIKKFFDFYSKLECTKNVLIDAKSLMFPIFASFDILLCVVAKGVKQDFPVLKKIFFDHYRMHFLTASFTLLNN